MLTQEESDLFANNLAYHEGNWEETLKHPKLVGIVAVKMKNNFCAIFPTERHKRTRNWPTCPVGQRNNMIESMDGKSQKQHPEPQPTPVLNAVEQNKDDLETSNIKTQPIITSVDV